MTCISEVADGIFNQAESFSLTMHFNWRKCQQRRVDGVLVCGNENVWSLENDMYLWRRQIEFPIEQDQSLELDYVVWGKCQKTRLLLLDRLLQKHRTRR